jgi:hypothetical protein
MSVMYKTCPDCGAHLDPGEHCDCPGPLWRVEAQNADGDTTVTHTRGQMARIIDQYTAQGLTVTGMVRILTI